jgi:hypothetical protein
MWKPLLPVATALPRSEGIPFSTCPATGRLSGTEHFGVAQQDVLPIARMRKGLYPASTYDPACPVGSYWDSTIADPGWRHPAPLQAQVGAEVVIVGGGLTGLSTALHLARDHGIHACLLEAGSLGWGASGRNGGFCGVGASHLTHTQMVRRVGLAETERYYRDQWQAVETVRELAASEGFSLEAQGQGCYAVAHRPQAWSELEAEYQICTQVAGYPAQLLNSKELRERGFDSQENHGALHIGVGFGLNPLKLTQGLAQAAPPVGGEAVQRQSGHGLGKGGIPPLLPHAGRNGARSALGHRHQWLHPRGPVSPTGGIPAAGTVQHPGHPTSDASGAESARVVGSDATLRHAAAAVLLPPTAGWAFAVWGDGVAPAIPRRSDSSCALG